MKIYILLFFLLFSNLALSQTQPIDNDGDGYLNISTLDELKWISENPDSWGKNFELDNNIDAAETKDWNDGEGYKPIGNFYGVFDGNNKVISNLTIIKNSKKSRDVGIIGNLEEKGTIKDLALVDSYVEGSYNTGGLVGNSSGGTILNCLFTGTVIGKKQIGGLVGNLVFGTISNCSSSGFVFGTDYLGGLVGQSKDGSIEYSYSESDVEGNEILGGLVGENSSVITNCYSRGMVKGNKDVGGLVGLNGYYIQECYSTGMVIGNYNIGGLIGRNQVYIHNCFWDMQTSRIFDSTDGIGKSTFLMKQKSTFTEVEWNFDEIWNIDDSVNDGYPFLNLAKLTSVEKLENVSLNIYPNPAKSIISFDLESHQIVEYISIVDITGKTVLESKIITGRDINVTELLSGTYFAIVKTRVGNFRDKFIKK